MEGEVIGAFVNHSFEISAPLQRKLKAPEVN